MNTGEVVRCAAAKCRSQAFVRYEGTNPTKWFCVWIEGVRKSFRCCSEECIAKVEEAYKGIERTF